MAPCEVGYGRGFGAGMLSEEAAVILGPGSAGQPLITHVALANGEVTGAREIPAFDEATVASDLCICLSAPHLFAVDTISMEKSWAYAREGERYHHMARVDDRLLVVFSNRDSGRYGVLRLDAETGEFDGILIDPLQPIIHDIAATGEVLVALTAELSSALPDECLGSYAMSMTEHPGGGAMDTLSLLAVPIDGQPSSTPNWHRILETGPVDELPEASILADSGKLYLERGSFLEARDMLSGRELGTWTVPGLDERLAWNVINGAGVLAEETRISVFELLA